MEEIYTFEIDTQQQIILYYYLTFFPDGFTASNTYYYMYINKDIPFPRKKHQISLEEFDELKETCFRKGYTIKKIKKTIFGR